MARLIPRIAFGLHAHQPAGNFDHVFEKITEQSYLPFLRSYKENNPPGKISYHASGILLDWWKNNNTEMIDLIGELVNEDKIEILGGGFYEPILPLIPVDDRKKQVIKLLDYTEELFGQRPEGIWLTERIWSPDLPGNLAKIGIKYTIVDDFHFQMAGWDRSKLNGYYMTEYNGSKLGIFPISQQLRYRIPFHDVDRLTEYLDENGDNQILTMADDAEKFGSWPDTYKWVYEDGWLERFFSACKEEKFELSSLGSVFETEKPGGRCYLPTSSYEEMLEWALPAKRLIEYEKWKQERPEDAEKFGSGGYFHNFLVKYEESNRLHKKMQWLSHRMDKENNKEAYEKLLAGQCNDSYWHGVFGGMCLPHLRGEAWKNLSAATERIESKATFLKLEDYNCDGQEELIYHNKDQFAVIDPLNGGELMTWEILEANRNILDTLTRRWEPYLEEDSKETNHGGDVKTIHDRKTKVPSEWLEDWEEDPIARAGFQPVMFENKPDCQTLARNQGIDYLLRGKDPLDICRDKKEVTLNYRDIIKNIGYRFSERELNWSASLDKEEQIIWGTVVNIGFRSPEKEYCYLEFNGKRQPANENSSATITELTLVDKIAGFKITVTPDSELDFFCYPLESISRSEEGAEKIYQGTCLVFASNEKKISLNWNWPEV